MLAIPDTKMLCRDQFCVGTTGLCWPKVLTFGCRADMSPTCRRHSQPSLGGQIGQIQVNSLKGMGCQLVGVIILIVQFVGQFFSKILDSLSNIFGRVKIPFPDSICELGPSQFCTNVNVRVTV
jgi:hypothetical protein